MRKRASRSSFFVSFGAVAGVWLAPAVARADEAPYGPPPAVSSPVEVRLHLYTPADAPPADLYQRDGIGETLVCTSPCHHTVRRDAHLIVRFGAGASSKPLDLSAGGDVDVVVRPGGDYEAVGGLAVFGAVAATAGSACLFVRMGDVPPGPINEQMGHMLGFAAAGMATLAVGAGLALVGVRLLRDPGPKTPDVSVRPVARR